MRLRLRSKAAKERAIYSLLDNPHICLVPVALAIVSILISLVIPRCHISKSAPGDCGIFLYVLAKASLLVGMLTLPLLGIILLVWVVAELWRVVR